MPGAYFFKKILKFFKKSIDFYKKVCYNLITRLREINRRKEKRKMMTVIEAVKKYGLENSVKSYKDQYGNTHNTDIPLKNLMYKEVKSINIFPFYDEVEITIII